MNFRVISGPKVPLLNYKNDNLEDKIKLEGLFLNSCSFISVSLASVSTCITTCKKAAPPPVPPRTTSKPYISVTVQSSTESAQDNYLDQQDRRSEVNSQSSHAHSNSSDSLDSTRANSLARGIPRPPHIIPTPIAIPREPVGPSTSNASTETSDSAIQRDKSGLNSGGLAAEEPLVAPVPRRKLSSIGIQVTGAGTSQPVLLLSQEARRFKSRCFTCS